ncbi:hypothetical protein N0V84_002425 [Fusarium piperis]|uniref:Uncharacterized protein n=1 Tax=Fusarium piperis TaxID=1435070 RepID=A0A9W8WJN1_9HYPO|nr:hypothetical protein N0V84_002425 [Fusarium piperis]
MQYTITTILGTDPILHIFRPLKATLLTVENVQRLEEGDAVDRIWNWVLAHGRVVELCASMFDTSMSDDDLVVCLSDATVSADSSHGYDEELLLIDDQSCDDQSCDDQSYDNQGYDNQSVLVAQFLDDFRSVFEHEELLKRVYN